MIKKLLRGLGWTLIIVLVLVLALLASVYWAGRPHHGRAEYVAMGSSFAAGPAITERAEDSPWFCGRSRDNYAHQYARMHGLSLVDVSCGGATTRHILKGGQMMQPAQLDAVTSETKLVTVTIGGNDIGYIGTLLAMACGDNTPWYWRKLGACKTRSFEAMELELGEVQIHLAAIIDEVRRKAPAAKVVLLTYSTVLPDNGTCGRLGLTEDQVKDMHDIATKLAEATRSAVESHGVLLLDGAGLTQGHDVCAKDPWINEMRPEGGVLGAPLHPKLAAMTAIAQGLDAMLGKTQH